MVGIGICLRDDRGEFISAKTDYFSPLCDVVVGEAVAFHTALKWMADLHYDNFDFALDSKIVVDHFRSYVEDDSELGCIMHAIVDSCLTIVFRTLISSSIGGKPMGSLMN